MSSERGRKEGRKEGRREGGRKGGRKGRRQEESEVRHEGSGGTEGSDAIKGRAEKE
jgi:hypothetical protein